MHDLIISWFTDFPRELATFFIATIPVTELRASIPVAVSRFGMTPFSAWFWSVLGTYCAMAFIVTALEAVVKMLSGRLPVFEKFFAWLFEHTRKKADDKMEKYGEWAIFILAATPIPLVGGFTGALAAFVFGVPLRRSLPLLLLGAMAAGAIVLGLTLIVNI